MTTFKKQLLFLIITGVILTTGVLISKAVGNLKVNPILGHDLDLDAKHYAQAANNTVHDITTEDISISAWVKVDTDASEVMKVLAKRITAGAKWLFGVDSTAGNGPIMGFNDGVDTFYFYTATNLYDNKWHHIAGIFDRDTIGNCKVYIDGLAGTVVRSGTALSIDSLTNSQILTIGANSDGTEKLDGQIRDVKLYYAAGDHWTDAQVLFQAQHPFDYSANAGTLTDYWRLDEGTGTTLYGKVNNLTLSNVLAWTTQPKIKMVNQQNATTTGNNPVGWWKMDEGTGQYAYDASGNGNTGTLGTSTVADGADPTWTTGKLGKGLSFDGVDDYVDAGNGASLNITGDITVGAWYKPTAFDNYRIVIRANGVIAPYNGFTLATDSATPYRRLRFHTGGGTTYASRYSNTLMNLNTWYYVVAVYKSGASPSSDIYVNGILDNGDLTGTGIPASLGNPNINLNIGRHNTPVGNYVNGLIDDVRVYNRALSAGEVQQQYNSTKDGYLGNIKVSTGLVGYWKLDDNNALTSVTDYSGKGNTGTAYSGTATSTSVLSTSTAMIGRAMSFDGVDDYVSIGDSAIQDTGGAITISAWIKTSVACSGDAIAVHDLSNYKWLLYCSGSPNAVPNFYVRTATGVSSVAPTINLKDGLWHHIVGTFDKTLSSNRLKIYVDGSLNKAVNGYAEDITAGDEGVYIGSNFDSLVTAGYSGLIDEVKIWNYARTAEQIGQDYVRGASGREQ